MVSINNLTFGYGKKDLFQNLSVQFKAGRIYGILGENGAGKTTLLKIICGLLKPQKGSCKMLGLKASSRFPTLLEELYFIPETFFIPPVSIRKYERLFTPFYSGFDQKHFYNILKEFKLPEEMNLGELSYGQKKKFLLAFGIATNCSVLTLDEPTNGLDIPSKGTMRRQIAYALNKGKAIIISTHQVRDMENLLDSIIILHQGRILFDHPMEEITSKLAFKIVSSLSEYENILYHDELPGGHAVLVRNNDDEETKIDLEFLFNAVLNEKDKIKNLFQD